MAAFGVQEGLSWRLPAEWAAHQATWMSWPFDEEMWWGQLGEVRREYAELVRTISRFEAVHLLVRDSEAEASAKALLGGTAVSLHKVPLNDVWLRDNGGLFVAAAGGEQALVDWGFNAWGGKYAWEDDNQVPKTMAAGVGLPRLEPGIIMEGGSLDVNGTGLCLTTEQCLLTPTRNQLSKAEIEGYLRRYLGVTQLIWLRDGLEGDHTDGHVDTISRFTDETTVVTSMPTAATPKDDLNWRSMRENRELLEQVQLADGRRLRVVELPLPETRLALPDGLRLPATYANFYILNDAVVVPQYGDSQDGAALEILRELFPKRQVIGLASRAIITGGGQLSLPDPAAATGEQMSQQQKLELALVQMPVSPVKDANLAAAEAAVRKAAAQGAQVILLPELFAQPYFCQVEKEAYFSWAEPVEGHAFLPRFQALAAELNVVLPISFFERSGPAYFNSLAMIDASGERLGVYRKSHIPDGPGYEEKYYFSPGDTGFKTWQTRYGSIGVGICWDQWFPECARAMVLQGADLLLYPTAIGSEPAEQVATPNTPAMWQRAMVGHAVHQAVYVAAANRIGTEHMDHLSCDFYGHSFTCDYRGDMLCAVDAAYDGILQTSLDLAAAREFRAGMGFFRDRRPDLYRSLLSLDGKSN